jgi:hypothetical protein
LLRSFFWWPRFQNPARRLLLALWLSLPRSDLHLFVAIH